MSDDRERDRKRKKWERHKKQRQTWKQTKQEPRVQEHQPGTSDPATAARETGGLVAGTTGEVFNAAGKVGFVIPAQGIEGAIRFEIHSIQPPGVPAGSPGWVQVLINGSEYCRINPDLCRPPYDRLADCVMIARQHRQRLPLGSGSAVLRVLPPAPHPAAQEILFWRERLLDGEVVMVDTPERYCRLGGRV